MLSSNGLSVRFVRYILSSLITGALLVGGCPPPTVRDPSNEGAGLEPPAGIPGESAGDESDTGPLGQFGVFETDDARAMIQILNARLPLPDTTGIELLAPELNPDSLLAARLSNGAVMRVQGIRSDGAIQNRSDSQGMRVTFEEPDGTLILSYDSLPERLAYQFGSGDGVSIWHGQGTAQVEIVSAATEPPSRFVFIGGSERETAFRPEMGAVHTQPNPNYGKVPIRRVKDSLGARSSTFDCGSSDCEDIGGDIEQAAGRICSILGLAGSAAEVVTSATCSLAGEAFGYGADLLDRQGDAGGERIVAGFNTAFSVSCAVLGDVVRTTTNTVTRTSVVGAACTGLDIAGNLVRTATGDTLSEGFCRYLRDRAESTPECAALRDALDGLREEAEEAERQFLATINEGYFQEISSLTAEWCELLDAFNACQRNCSTADCASLNCTPLSQSIDALSSRINQIRHSFNDAYNPAWMSVGSLRHSSELLISGSRDDCNESCVRTAHDEVLSAIQNLQGSLRAAGERWNSLDPGCDP